jgi:hypothetical protein
MIERICPSCQHGNPLDDRYCGKCGTPLERQLPARSSDAQLMIAGRALPVTWKQLSRTVAVSVAALAAEAGIAWLRRRMDSPSTALASPKSALARSNSTASSQNATVKSQTTVVSQRTIEVEQTNTGKRVVERSFWRRIEE